ncbi:MAG: S-layer homology domain-containing protein [Clostridia bacterium]|nr:S-layer homology domain-containing protein [Clostridia bacterium]
MRVLAVFLVLCLSFSFVTATAENIPNDTIQSNEIIENKIDISKYTESINYHVEKIILTEYGTVLYFWPEGTPHGKNPKLALIKDDGSEVNLSESVSKLDFYHTPELENIVLAEDGKTLLFSVSFNERSEGTIADGEKIVLHDAGTYFYKANLEEGICIETKFEPLDIISEEIISAWAKTEVENAIEMGFVPLSFRDNYKRNITRGEFAKLAMFFLSVQYGYPGVPAVQLWSPIESSDNSFFSREFMNAYCSSRTDRNGNSFTDKSAGNAYIYNNDREIFLDVTPFSDVNENKDLSFIERAYHLGIVNGISETEFNPDGEITRQEAAAMLMRVYKNYAETEKTSGEVKFSDDKDIAEWAKEDVYSINSLGIMQGAGENIFEPLNGYTVEQAIITFWRLYDSAPISRKNKNISPLLEYEFELENYFNRAAGTSYFNEQSRKEYENFIVVCGWWSRRHITAWAYSLYVFDKRGGVPYAASLTEDMKWEVSSDEKVITCYGNVGDTFRLYNKLNGTEKVYGIGIYKTEYSIEQGKILNFERVK